MPSNPFLSPGGASGVPVPTPMFTGGGYAPTLIKMAREYAKAAQQNVMQQQGQAGLLNSSFTGAGLERAYRGGFDRASQEFQGQQNVYNQWAQGMFQLKAAEAGAPREKKWWEQALEIALPVAGLYAAFKSPTAAVSPTKTG